MAWKNGMGLVTANKLFEKYGVMIAQDSNTKIYTATLGDKTIQHTSVSAIAETILERWFILSEPYKVTPADIAIAALNINRHAVVPEIKQEARSC